MSEPPNTSSIVLLDPHHPRHQYLPPILSPQPTSSSSLQREYRKGNWTLHETLVLITAKKMDDERRSSAQSKPSSSSSSPSSSCRTAELRWKWVENYCWSQGCHRSQNQCNDKWDNLLRDYKKVRDYEARAADSKEQQPSYWQMEKHERKERSLPSNLLQEVFQALHEVVNRKYSQKNVAAAASTAVIARPPIGPPPLPTPPPPPPPPLSQALPHLSAPPPVPLQQQQLSGSVWVSNRKKCHT